MKILAVIAGVLLLLAALVWSNRIDVLFWVMPKLMEIGLDTPPNRPLDWESGPEQAAPLWPSFIDTPILIDRMGDNYQPGDKYVYWQN